MAKKKTEIYLGTGRRKSSVARVFLKAGKGSIIVNDQDVNEYMPYQTLVMDLKQPLTLLDVADKLHRSSWCDSLRNCPCLTRSRLRSRNA